MNGPVIKVGISMAAPPHFTDCAIYFISALNKGLTPPCSSPGIYMELFQFLATVMKVSVEWHLKETNAEVLELLKSGELDASARMKEQGAFVDNPELTVCDYGLYEKTVYLLRKPIADDLVTLKLLRPFSKEIWLLLIALFIITILFLYYLHKLENRLDDEKQKQNFLDACFRSFAIFVKSDDQTTPKFISETIFICIVVSFIYVLSVCYETFVVDNLVNIVQMRYTMSNKEFYNFVVKNEYKIVYHSDRGSRFFRPLVSNNSATSNMMNDLLFYKKRYQDVNDSDEALALLTSTHDKIMVPREWIRAKYFLQQHQDFMSLTVLEDPFSYAGFVFPRNSSYLTECNYWMKKSSALMANLIKKYVSKDRNFYLDVGLEKFQFKNCADLGCFWIIGLLVASLVFFAERRRVNLNFLQPTLRKASYQLKTNV